MRKNTFRALAAAAGMLVLIFDSRAALNGAREGIDLCIRTLIPSLFPFFVLSALVTGNLMGQPIRSLRPICSLCGMPEGTESILAVGLLGGYPVGAQNISAAYRSGALPKADAERMLAFCSNAGPAFIFGILGQMFSKPAIPWILWGVHIFSALIVGMVLRNSSKNAEPLPCRSTSVSEALESALKVMALVCGWVVLFRMILMFMDRWFLWMLPEIVRILAAGLLELSNGCIQLGNIASEGVRFLLAGIFLSAGGVCVMMQTRSVTKGLSLKPYFCGKGIQTVISFQLCILLQPVVETEARMDMGLICFFAGLLICIFSAFILRSRKKRSSIPAAVGV